MKSFFTGLAALIAILLPAVSNAAEDPVAKGAAIAREWERRDLGFGDSKATLSMVLENRKGQTSERKMRIQTLGVADEGQGDKSLVVFDEPRDVKGTALLSYAHILEPDDQWLYLPALKRVKRISSANKSGPFVGSEFAYEDITGEELKKYSYTWLRDEPCGELDCFVVERRPLYEKSGYTRLVTWYDTADYQVRRVDYYDRKDDLLKTLTLTDYRRYLDRFWRAHDLFMENHQTGKKTRLRYESYAFQTGLTDGDFNKSNLKRAR
jgi:outer membrane lipoprotein-sorting protein